VVVTEKELKGIPKHFSDTWHELVLIDIYKTPEKLPYSSLMVPVEEIKTI